MATQPNDLFLVNRGTDSYAVTNSGVMQLLQDTDLLLVNRGVDSFSISGAAFKESIAGAPQSVSVSIAPTSNVIEGDEIIVNAVSTGGGAAPFTYQYQWYRNDVTIASASGILYTLNSNDVGKKVNCLGTQFDKYGFSVSGLSNYTDFVKGAETVSTPTLLTPKDGAGMSPSGILFPQSSSITTVVNSSYAAYDNSQDWSNNNANYSAPAVNAFDGKFDTSGDADSYPAEATTTFSSPIKGSIVEVYIPIITSNYDGVLYGINKGLSTNTEYSIDYSVDSGASWITVYSDIEINIANVYSKRNSTTYGSQQTAWRVDGQILIDSDLSIPADLQNSVATALTFPDTTDLDLMQGACKMVNASGVVISYSPSSSTITDVGVAITGGYNTSQVWSDGTESGAINSSQPWEKGFDGDSSIATYAQASSSGATLVLDNPIAFSKLEVSVGGTIVLNDVLISPTTAYEFYEVTGVSSRLTKIELPDGQTLAAIKADGLILVDTGAIDQSKTWSNFVTAQAGWLNDGRDGKKIFNNDGMVSAVTSGGKDYILFEETITVTSSVSFWIERTNSVTITDTLGNSYIYSTPSLPTSPPGGEYEITAAALTAQGLTTNISSIKIINQEANTVWYGMSLNGKKLVDPDAAKTIIGTELTLTNNQDLKYFLPGDVVQGLDPITSDTEYLAQFQPNAADDPLGKTLVSPFDSSLIDTPTKVGSAPSGPNIPAGYNAYNFYASFNRKVLPKFAVAGTSSSGGTANNLAYWNGTNWIVDDIGPATGVFSLEATTPAQHWVALRRSGTSVGGIVTDADGSSYTVSNFYYMVPDNVSPLPSVKVISTDSTSTPPTMVVDGGQWAGTNTGGYNTSQNWSSNLSGSDGISSGLPASNAFDGNLTTKAGNDLVGGGSLTYSGSINGNNIRVLTGLNNDVTIDGVSIGQAPADPSWVSGTISGGSLNNIVITASGAGTRADLYAIELDSKILVDGPWNQSEVWSSEGTIVNPASGDIPITHPAYNPLNLYDGNLSTSWGTVSITVKSQTGMSIPFTTSFKVLINANIAQGTITFTGANGSTGSVNLATDGWVNSTTDTLYTVTGLQSPVTGFSWPLLPTGTGGMYLIGIYADDVLLVDKGIGGENKVTGPANTGTGTFLVASGTTAHLNSSNQRWIESGPWDSSTISGTGNAASGVYYLQGAQLTDAGVNPFGFSMTCTSMEGTGDPVFASSTFQVAASGDVNFASPIINTTVVASGIQASGLSTSTVYRARVRQTSQRGTESDFSTPQTVFKTASVGVSGTAISTSGTLFYDYNTDQAIGASGLALTYGLPAVADPSRGIYALTYQPSSFYPAIEFREEGNLYRPVNNYQGEYETTRSTASGLLVELLAAASGWSASVVYASGALVTHSGELYQTISGVTSSGVFDPTRWTNVSPTSISGY